MEVRRGARVLLLDEWDRLLLFKMQDRDIIVPARPIPDMFWITVGGGLEQGESFEDAARREVWEETGIRDFALGAWVWESAAEAIVYGERQHFYQRFYLGRARDTAVDLSRLTSLEQGVYRAHHWWSLSEMRETTETLLPLGLPDLLADVLERRWREVIAVL